MFDPGWIHWLRYCPVVAAFRVTEFSVGVLDAMVVWNVALYLTYLDFLAAICISAPCAVSASNVSSASELA